MNISFSNFVNNKALIEGGAIKWNDEKPYCFNNTFINNSAIYGENIASFPLRMILNYFDKKEFSESKYTAPKKDEILLNKSEKIITLTNISSGNSIPFVLEFILVDVYGKIVNLNQGLFSKT